MLDKQQTKNRSCGIIVLEFVLILPVFILLVFGSIDIYWLLHTHNTMSAAAREGARAMVIDNVSKNKAKDITRRYLCNSGFDAAKFQITVNKGSHLKQVSVQINVPVKDILLTGIKIYPNETLSVISIMRN